MLRSEKLGIIFTSEFLQKPPVESHAVGRELREYAGKERTQGPLPLGKSKGTTITDVQLVL